MIKQPFRVGLVQMSCPDPKDNLAKAVEKVREAAARGAQVVLLQELFRSQYFCREVVHLSNFDLAETIPGPTTDVMGKLAKELGVVIVASLFEKRAPGLYHNTTVVLSTDGSIAGMYRKMHIPDDPSYFEKYYFTPGDLGFGSIDTPFAKLGVLVCWDQWYPEAARITALSGADILIYPTAIGWVPEDKAEGAWQIEASLAPEGEVEEWLQVVSNGCELALNMATKEDDVMQIFKKNKKLFDAVKATNAPFFKNLMAKFTEAKNKFKE